MLSLDKAHTTVKYVAAIADKNQIDEKIRQGHEKVLESRKYVKYYSFQSIIIIYLE